MSMKIFILLLVLLPVRALALSATIQPGGFSASAEESLYRKYYREFFESPGFSSMPKTAEEQKLALDAIEDGLLNGAPTLKLANWFTSEQLASLVPVEKIRLIRLKAAKKIASEKEKAEALSLAKRNTDSRTKYELRRLRIELGNAEPFIKKFRAPSVAEVKSLYSELPDLAGFMNGRYNNMPRIFVFCRHDHNYPCLLSMRDKNNEVVKENGKTWLQPALGLSAYALPYNQRNGNTPQGAQLIDGVMPVADMPLYYGKFRRMVLTFAPASANEVEQKKLFPPAVQGSSWWQEAVEARDMGRNLLRIHGVGEINPEPAKPYYPFIPTIGCLAQLEGKYGDNDYTDQRKLLDHFMTAAGLEAKFENEPRIRGVMYTIEIDDRTGPVRATDLKPFGIQ